MKRVPTRLQATRHVADNITPRTGIPDLRSGCECLPTTWSFGLLLTSCATHWRTDSAEGQAQAAATKKFAAYLWDW